ncbi:other 1 kinase [Pyrrhoderma noxium]|uniref:Other 1 kinase n=1 Tax=Pyrrhoderma noxium TaxID=2282107 RepID=A0A286UWW1_9AGAM|nr:other 1 kinase [Pyrrhoderma noxium]
MSASDSSPPPSPSPSTSSVDSEDQDISFNKRISPSWKTYQSLFERRGYHLDTAYDVRLYYERVFPGGIIPDSPAAVCQRKAYRRACEMRDDELCRDEGLPETLFRGTCKRSKKRIVVKAVGLYSRQYAIIRLLSSKPLRDDPMNHTIPVVDLIEVPESQLAFIVQEEWSSEIIDTENPCPLPSFLRALHQCIEGLVFMHAHGVAHLDISLRNILTDFEGHYAYIDFETSRLYPYWNDDRSREVSRYDDKDTTKSKRENHLGENMPYSNSAQNDSQRSLYPQFRLRSHIYSSSSSSASSSPSSSLSPSPNPSFISSNTSSLVDLVPSYPLNIPKKVHGQHNQTGPVDKSPDNSITSGFDGRRNKFPSPLGRWYTVGDTWEVKCPGIRRMLMYGPYPLSYYEPVSYVDMMTQSSS